MANWLPSVAASGHVQIEVVPATDDDRTVVRRLIQLYHYDFSEFDGADVNRHGEYLHPYFDEYWTADDRRAFLFRADGNWAGFAFVYTGEPHDIAEFFVMRKYRRHGMGRRAAVSLFERFPGRWTVRQLPANTAATAFWRQAIPWPFDEEERDGEVVQSFTTPVERRQAGG